MIMKKILIAIVYFQICFMVGSCQKLPPLPPVTPPPPFPKTYPTHLEILWNTPFHSDSTEDFFWDYTVANNQYLVLANIYDKIYGKPRGIGVYNMQTGERHSAWQNDPGGIFGVSEREDLMDCKIVGKNKDIILIYNQFGLFAYSLHNGQRLWNLNLSYTGIPHISAEGDNAFICYGPGGGAFSKSWHRLAMVDVYSGKKRDIVQLEIEDNFEFSINPPSAYVNSAGDTLLFFTTDCGNFETIQGRGNAYCYNLTKKEMIWINKQSTDIERNASASHSPPFVIENDKLIITGRSMIYCLNLHTGELVWEKEDVWATGCNPLYHEGKLYIRSGNPCTLLCLDAQTGQTVWANPSINPIPVFHGAMAIYKDKLYFSAKGANATSHLACIDIQTGKELWRDRGPYGNIAFGVLIDQRTGYLYCYTGWSMLCVDLNKTPRK